MKLGAGGMGAMLETNWEIALAFKKNEWLS